MNTTDTTWAVPGAPGVIVSLGRGHAEPDRIYRRVRIDRIGKRDIVAVDTFGNEHRFRVNRIYANGFTAAGERAWSVGRVLVDPANPIVTGAALAEKASDAYRELIQRMDTLRRERTSANAEAVNKTSALLSSALRSVEDAEQTESQR